MARHLACLRHIAWMAAVVPLALAPIAGASGHDLDLMTHDLMAQEAHLAEFGWEETVLEDGAILLRQGQEDYLPFLVRTETAYPFPFLEDYYYEPPPIVVRRAGLRVTVNGGGKSFSYWPPVEINTEDPGPPPALGPNIPDANGQIPEDVDNYWRQKRIHLVRNYDLHTACVKFYECLKESSELSGGEWTVLGNSPKDQFYSVFEIYSKKLDRISGLMLSQYTPPPAPEALYATAKGEYEYALANCMDFQSVLSISPSDWGRRFQLTRPNAVEDLAVLMSDLPQGEKLAKMSRFNDPDLFPIVHSSPELEARLERARLEREAAEPEM